MRARLVCPACNELNICHCFWIKEFDIWRCKICSTIFVYNLPQEMGYSKLYESDKYYELPIESVKRIQSENKRRLRVLKSYKPNGRFLDVGCARGLLLDEALQANYDTYGIELSPRNVKISSENGHQVFHGDLEEYKKNHSGEKFDIVACLDVIEHVSDPDKFLNIVVSLLSKDGILIVSTPNYSGVVAKVLGNRDPFLIPPEHLTFFTSKGLQRLIGRCGLKIKKKITFGKLTEDELDRSFYRYFPKMFWLLKPGIKKSISLLLVLLNFIKLGLELEIYLSKRSP